MYTIIIVLHVLAATIWTGGHIVLATIILPRAFADKNPTDLLKFEAAYERIGIPALLVQVVSGLWLAYRAVPDFWRWVQPDDFTTSLIAFKLVLLLATLGIALDARLRIIPNLSAQRLTVLAWHIVPVTLIAIVLATAGAVLRSGGFY